jgi:hypothetical protein
MDLGDLNIGGTIALKSVRLVREAAVCSSLAYNLFVATPAVTKGSEHTC